MAFDTSDDVNGDEWKKVLTGLRSSNNQALMDATDDPSVDTTPLESPAAPQKGLWDSVKEGAKFFNPAGVGSEPIAGLSPKAAAGPTGPIPMPNGGMEGSALDKYIAANPGPVATTGFNPNNPGAQSDLLAQLQGSMDFSSPGAPSALSGGGGSRARGPAGKSDSISSSQAAPSAGVPDLQSLIKNAYGEGNSDADLKSAQDKAMQIGMWANMMKGANQISAGLSRGGATAQNEPLNDMEKMAPKMAENILQRRDAQDKAIQHEMNVFKLSDEQQKNNPNSQASMFARDMLTKFGQLTGMKVNTGNASFNDLEKTFGPMEQIAAAMERAKQTRIMMGMRQDQQRMNMGMKYANVLGEDLDPYRARGGAFGTAASNLQNTERADQLLKQNPDGNLTPQQMEEIALAGAKLIGGGSQTAEGIVKKLVPSSLWGDSAGIAQWVRNAPTGAGQQAFVKQMQDTIHRERSLAEAQILQTQLERAHAGANLRFKQMDPETWLASVAQRTHLSPSQIADYEKDNNYNRFAQSQGLAGLEQSAPIQLGKGPVSDLVHSMQGAPVHPGAAPAPTAGSVNDPDVLRYAATHKNPVTGQQLTPDEALAIKQKRMQGMQ